MTPINGPRAAGVITPRGECQEITAIAEDPGPKQEKVLDAHQGGHRTAAG
jgi:hypothetical protein